MYRGWARSLSPLCSEIATFLLDFRMSAAKSMVFSQIFECLQRNQYLYLFSCYLVREAELWYILIDVALLRAQPKVVILDGRSQLFWKLVTNVSRLGKVTVIPVQRNHYFFQMFGCLQRNQYFVLRISNVCSEINIYIYSHAISPEKLSSDTY